MSVIDIPRKHLRQPHGRLSLAEPWSFCLVNGRGINGEPGVPITAGVPQIVPSPSGGLALRTSATAAAKFAFNTAGVFSACMGVAVYRRTGTLAAYASLGTTRVSAQGVSMLLNNAGESQNSVRCVHSTNVTRSDVYGTVKDSAQITTVAFFIDKNGNHGLYEAGKDIHTSFNGSGDLQSNGSFFYTGTESSSSVAAPVDGEVSLFALAYGRGSREEARQLSLAPWQIFRADPIRIYSLPSGPISLAINSITASNITQTGARITLGLTR